MPLAANLAAWTCGATGYEVLVSSARAGRGPPPRPGRSAGERAGPGRAPPTFLWQLNTAVQNSSHIRLVGLKIALSVRL